MINHIIIAACLIAYSSAFTWRVRSYLTELTFNENREALSQCISAWGVEASEVFSGHVDVAFESSRDDDFTCGSGVFGHYYNGVITFCKGKVWSVPMLTYVCTHELGHGLGLLHFDADEDSIMKSWFEVKDHPSAGDLERLAALDDSGRIVQSVFTEIEDEQPENVPVTTQDVPVTTQDVMSTTTTPLLRILQGVVRVKTYKGSVQTGAPPEAINITVERVTRSTPTAEVRLLLLEEKGDVTTEKDDLASEGSEIVTSDGVSTKVMETTSSVKDVKKDHDWELGRRMDRFEEELHHAVFFMAVVFATSVAVLFLLMLMIAICFKLRIIRN